LSVSGGVGGFVSDFGVYLVPVVFTEGIVDSS
jgi:hypothetical protein